jgi:hypothetical protein
MGEGQSFCGPTDALRHLPCPDLKVCEAWRVQESVHAVREIDFA